MNLTSKQILVLDFIKRFIAEHGYSPTVREITAGLLLKSPATVQEHLKNLVKKGMIRINPNKSRTIELLVINEYINVNQDYLKLPVLNNYNPDNYYTEYLDIPKYLIGESDSKYTFIYKLDNLLYIVDKNKKPYDNDLVLYFDKTLKVKNFDRNSTDKILGVIIVKVELFND